MKATFVQYARPPITAMIVGATPEEMISEIVDALYDGADALGLQLCGLRKEYRNEETLREIFAACEGRPIYMTSYRGAHSVDLTDEERAELLLLGLKSGGTLCDVMGDLFHPEPHEMTFDEEAVAKQKALIDKIHEMGGEVLMSAHLHAFFEEEDIVRFAKAQVERGADVVKLVSFAQTEEQMMADVNIIHRLKKELDKPFLFLANGPWCRFIRQAGPALGVCMYLGVTRHKPSRTPEQPTVQALKAIRDHMLY